MNTRDPPPDQAQKRDAFADVKAARERAVAEQQRAARAALAARAGDQVDLAAAVAEARRRAGVAAIGPGGPARLALPPAAVAAIGGSAERVDHAKIHAADVRSIPYRPDTGLFLAAARRAARYREPGDPQRGTLGQVAQAVAYFTSRQRRGFCRVRLADLATSTGYCVETVRKSLRFLAGGGILDVLNVLERRVTADGVRRLVRGANLYLIRPPADQEPPPPPDQDVPPAGAVLPRAVIAAAGVIARWASVFGLAIRHRGLNTAPARGSG